MVIPLPQPVKAVQQSMVPVRQHLVQEAILPLISLLPIAAQREILVGFFPAVVSPAVKFAANARKEPARGLPLLHPAVRPEPPAGQSVRQPVMPVIRLITLVPQRLVLPVRLMPTETAAPIRYGQLTAIIPAMTNAEPALQPAKERSATI